MGGGHLDLLAVVDMGHSGVFKQGDPEAGGGARLAERKIERMQVAGAHVDKAADIAIRSHHAMDIFPRYQLEFVLIAEARQMVEILLEASQMTLTGGEVAVAPGEIALDVEALNPLAHQLHRLQPHQVELANPLLTNPADKLAGIVADTANKLATIAPGGAPADAVGLQQGDLVTGISQIDGGIETGKTAADDADVSLVLPLQLGPLLPVVAGGRVVGGDMLLISVVLSCLHTQHPALVANCLIK